MAWSKAWRFVGDADSWEEPDGVGDEPGAYKLGVGKTKASVASVYIGFTQNLRADVLKHAKEQPENTRKKVRAAFNKGLKLYCKVHPTDDAEDAKFLKADELEENGKSYPWNLKRPFGD